MSWRVKRKICGDGASALESTEVLEADEDTRSPVRGIMWSKYSQFLSESDSNDNDGSGNQSEVNELASNLEALKVAKPKKKRRNRKRAYRNEKELSNFENQPSTSSPITESHMDNLSEDTTEPTLRIQENLLEVAPTFRSLMIMRRLLNPPLAPTEIQYTRTRMELVGGGHYLSVLEKCRIIPGVNMEMYLEKKGLKYFKFNFTGDYAVTRNNFFRFPPEANTYYNFQENTFLLENVIKHIGLSTDDSMIDKQLKGGFYLIEQSFHKAFNITELNIRLPYVNKENRYFLILLFLRALQFQNDGLYRSALEICKLAIKLDHSDPLTIILLIDYFALEAREFSWFIEFVKKWILHYPCEWMPNIMYSMAFAHYRTAMAKGGDLSTAEFYVKKGLLTYPMLLLPLLKKCRFRERPTAHQKIILQSKFFKEFDTDLSPLVTKLCELYIKATFQVWISDKPLKWLMKNAVEVLNMVDEKHDDVERYANIRKKVQHSIPQSLKRYIFLHKLINDYTDHTETCPWDPYPPLNSSQLY